MKNKFSVITSKSIIANLDGFKFQIGRLLSDFLIPISFHLLLVEMVNNMLQNIAYPLKSLSIPIFHPFNLN